MTEQSESRPAVWVTNHHQTSPCPVRWNEPDIIFAAPAATKKLTTEQLQQGGYFGVWKILPSDAKIVPSAPSDPVAPVEEPPSEVRPLWPLESTPLWPDLPGHFGCVRKFDVHTGVDLYCEPGSTVLAMEDGVIVGIEDFTGMGAGTPWWRDTKALLVEGKTGVIVYGEIEVPESTAVGMKVSRGDGLGWVTPVLQEFKGRPMTMLHLEVMKHGSRQTVVWDLDSPMPECLLPPHNVLCDADHPYFATVDEDSGIPVFNLATYNGKEFRA